MYTSLTNTYDIDNNGILKIYLDHAGISSVLKRTTEKDMIEIVISNSEYDSNISYRFYAGMLDRDMATINLIKGDKVHISCYNDRDYPIPEERSPFVTFFEHFVDEDIKDKKYQSSDKTLSYNRDYVMADYNYPIDGYLYIDDNYIYFKRETRIVFKETDFDTDEKYRVMYLNGSETLMITVNQNRSIDAIKCISHDRRIVKNITLVHDSGNDAYV